MIKTKLKTFKKNIKSKKRERNKVTQKYQKNKLLPPPPLPPPTKKRQQTRKSRIIKKKIEKIKMKQ